MKREEPRTDHSEHSGIYMYVCQAVHYLGPCVDSALSYDRICLGRTKRSIHSTIEYANVNYSYITLVYGICICVYSTYVYIHSICRIGAGNASYGNILNTLLPLAFRLLVVVCANKWSWRHTLRPAARWFSRRCNMRHMHAACPQPEQATT